MADLAKSVPIGGLQWEPPETEEETRRRSIYIFQRRSLPLPMMAAFDAGPFSESCPRRSSTTTPLQALSFMNGALVNEEAAQLAARIRREAGENRGVQIQRLFEVVLNRAPEAEESARLLQGNHPLEALCRIVLSSNEMLYLE